MRSLIIFGAGGFGQEAIWVAESQNEHLPPAERWDILGYLDDDASKVGREYYGHRVLASAPPRAELWYHCALGSNSTRETVAARLDALGWKAATLIHSSVIRARGIEVGEGTYIGAGSILSPSCKIGRHVLINQRVAIGHDSVLEDFSQACPGAQINGYCKVLRGALVGSNASIHQGRIVGAGAVVGANSLVIRNVEPGVTVLGVPGQAITRAAGS